MKPEDRQGFLAIDAELDFDEHVIETYWFETSEDPYAAAAALCREHSTAQWKRPGYEEDFRPKHAAKVIALDVVDESREPLFKSPFTKGDRFFHCVARIAHPHRNFGAKIPNLLTAVAGEGVFFCHAINAIKLIDVSFPKNYIDNFEGPRFGTEGLRKLLNVTDRPLFFGVVKPNIGLDVDAFAKLAYESWMGGLDVAKDDEMIADVPWSPLKERAAKVGRMRLEAEAKTGMPKMYLANITDEVDCLCEQHDVAVGSGANAVMVNGMTTGLSAIRMLRRHADVPIVAHFDMIAPFSRMPFFGIDTTVFTKLQRMVGFDAIIMPGFEPRMMMTDEEVIANCAACASDLGLLKRSLPLPGGSDWAGTLEKILTRMKTTDFGLIPGRGVFGHPQGPRAGAMSLHQAWEAYLTKTPLEEYARGCPELAAAIDAFGITSSNADTEGVFHEESSGAAGDHDRLRN